MIHRRAVPHPRRRAMRGGGWRLHRFFGFLLGASVLAALAAGVLQHRLRQGPLPLPVVAELAESRLNLRGGGLRYRVGGASFVLGEPGRPSGLVLTDLAVIGPDGRVVASAPRLSAALRLSDLVAGRVRPRALMVSGVALTLLRRADGSVGLMPGGAAGDADPAAAGALFDGPEAPLSDLARLVADRAELVLRDEMTGRAWRLSGAHLEIDLGAERQTAEARGRLSPFDVGEDAATPTRIVMRGTREVATGDLELAARFDALGLARLAEAVPELAPLAALEADASGELRLAQDGAGALGAFDAVLRLGPGRLAGVEGAAGGFDAAEMRLAWEPEAGRLRIDRLEASAEAGVVAASGSVTAWPAAPGAAPAGWSVALELERLDLAEAAGFAAPVSFDRGVLAAEVLPDRRRIEVSRLSLASAALSFEARGALERGEAGWSLAASVSSEGFSVDALVRHWPPAVAPGGRRWVARNLRAGTVNGVEAWLWLGPGEAEPELTLDFGFRDLAADIVPGLPPVDGADGRGRLTLGRLDLDFAAAGTSLPEGGRIDLAGSRFSIPALGDDPPGGVATLSGRGRVPDLLALLDRPPLGLVSRLGADVSWLDGTAEVSARLALPLLADLAVEQVSVSAEAALSEVTGRPPGLDLDLSSERLTLVADLRSLTLEGPILIDGTAASLAWTERYGGSEEPARRVRLSGAPDAATLRRLGLTTVEVLGGSVAATLELEGLGTPRLTLTADLGEAELRLPRLGWSKPAGTAGRLTASGTAGEDGVSVDRFALQGGDLSVSGSARLAADGGLRRLDLSRLALADALDVTLNLERDVAGAIAARVGGALIDLVGISGRLGVSDAGEADGAGAPAIEARIAVDRVIAAPGFVLHDARGRVARRDGVLRARLSGAVNGGGEALLRYRDEPGNDPLLSLRSADAGRMLADLGLGGAAADGELRIRARVPRDRDGVVTGVAEISGIRVADAAALGRVLDAADAEARLGASAAAREGYLFDRVRVPFTLRETELRVEEALAVGPSLGVKLDGAYDRQAGRLDFAGVLTPAYAINGLLNSVPLVGLLLGGEGEGLFALTFTVEGPLGAPEISANPLSVLTPGVFRRLFQGSEPGEAPPDLFREMER